MSVHTVPPPARRPERAAADGGSTRATQREPGSRADIRNVPARGAGGAPHGAPAEKGAAGVRRSRFLLAELLAVGVIGLSVLLYSQMPTVWGLRAQRLHEYPEKVFTTALTTYADDTASYWAWIREARGGSFFLTDLYTPEEHPRNFVNVFFWILGVAARVTGLSVETVYMGARVLMGLALFVVLYALCRRLFHRPGERIACFLVFLLSGGWEGVLNFLERNLGWAHVPSPGWWTPEMSTFFSLMLFPHFLAGFVAMLGAMLLLMTAWANDGPPAESGIAPGALGLDMARPGSPRTPPRPEPLGSQGGPSSRFRRGFLPAAGVGLVMFALTFFHPYDVVPVMATLWTAPALFGLSERRWPWTEWAHSLVASLIWLPAFLYNVWIFTSNPAMRWWDLQNLMKTPEPVRLIIAFGVNGILAVLALLAFRRLGRPHLVMAAWLVSALAIIQLPLRFQRRMIGGIQFPLAALATAAVAFVVVPAASRYLARRRLAQAGGAAARPGRNDASSPASASSDPQRETPAPWSRGVSPAPAVPAVPAAPAAPAPWGWGTLAAVVLLLPLQAATPYYLRDIEWNRLRTVHYPSWLRVEEYDALHALEGLTPTDARILSSYEMGNLIPPYSGRRSVIGHYALTIDSREKQKQIDRFFAAAKDDDPWRLEFLRHWSVGYVFLSSYERRLGGFDAGSRDWLEEVYASGGGPARRVAVYRVKPLDRDAIAARASRRAGELQ